MGEKDGEEGWVGDGGDEEKKKSGRRESRGWGWRAPGERGGNRGLCPGWPGLLAVERDGSRCVWPGTGWSQRPSGRPQACIRRLRAAASLNGRFRVELGWWGTGRLQAMQPLSATLDWATRRACGSFPTGSYLVLRLALLYSVLFRSRVRESPDFSQASHLDAPSPRCPRLLVNLLRALFIRRLVPKGRLARDLELVGKSRYILVPGAGLPLVEAVLVACKSKNTCTDGTRSEASTPRETTLTVRLAPLGGPAGRPDAQCAGYMNRMEPQICMYLRLCGGSRAKYRPPHARLESRTT